MYNLKILKMKKNDKNLSREEGTSAMISGRI